MAEHADADVPEIENDDEIKVAVQTAILLFRKCWKDQHPDIDLGCQAALLMLQSLAQM